MGLLVDGQWHDKWYDTKSSDGKFIRSTSQFRHWITKDGAAGPTGDAGFQAEKGRYHLFASYACPWVHRTLMMRSLKGLEDFIAVSFVHWRMKEHGWTFEADPDNIASNIIGDKLFGFDYVHQIYTKADPKYSGRVTVPILWDTQKNTIISNESSEIIRMFNSAFDDIGAQKGDYYPENLRVEIDELNDFIYDTINNGVYKAGFATTQQAYEDAVFPLFEALDSLEKILSNKRFLCGHRLTEADIRLFPTLYRFDNIYVGHFKCGLRRLTDYPNLWRYAREVYGYKNIKETVNMDHARKHYYQSHDMINPTGVVTVTSEANWEEKVIDPELSCAYFI